MGNMWINAYTKSGMMILINQDTLDDTKYIFKILCEFMEIKAEQLKIEFVDTEDIKE